jgi:hypothetical protein
MWVRLFQKDGWDDRHGIREIIAGLREDQKTHEAAQLNNGSQAAGRAAAVPSIYWIGEIGIEPARSLVRFSLAELAGNQRQGPYPNLSRCSSRTRQ